MNITELKGLAEDVNVPMYLPERTPEDISRLRDSWNTYYEAVNPQAILQLIAVAEQMAEALEHFGLSKNTRLTALTAWKKLKK